MVLAGIVAAYASIKFLAAPVLDGYDVQSGVPMSALGEWCNIGTMDCRPFVTGRHHVCVVLEMNANRRHKCEYAEHGRAEI